MNIALIAAESLRPRLRELVLLARGQVVAPDAEAGVDVTLVSGSEASAKATVPALVRQGQAVWVVPESVLGSEFVYEQIPLDDEYPHQLRAIWPLRLAAAVMELKRQLVDRRFGAILHLQMERTTSGGPTFFPEIAHAAWLQDADLLRYLAAGDYKRVTAIHSGLSSQGITTASVSLNGDDVPDAMWAFRAVGSPRAELTITTDRGAAVLAWEGDASPTLTVNCQLVALSPDSPSPVPPHAPLAGPIVSLTGSHEDRGDTGLGESGDDRRVLPEGVTAWGEAVRAFDLLDAARRSLLRKRTVELQFESTSERSQFKTHMTAVGCSLLLLTILGWIGLLFAGRMLDPRDTQQKQSENAGFVFTSDQFDGPQLNSHGRETMTEIVENFGRRSATILIDGDPSAAESVERRAVVVRELESAKLDNGEVRTLVRPLQGVWFKRGMLVAWVVLFLPLGVMLAIQLLIGVTPSPGLSARRPLLE